MRRRIWCAGLAILLAMAMSSAVRAQPLADRLPEDTLFYLGWRGVEQMGEGFEGSHFQAVLRASRAQALVGDFLTRAAERLGQEDAKAERGLKLLGALAQGVWRYPTALYFGGLAGEPGEPGELGDPGDPGDPGFPGFPGDRPLPKLAMLVQAGDQAEALARQLREMVEAEAALAANPENPVSITSERGLVIVSVRGVELGLAAAGQRALGQSARFRQAMTQVAGDPALVAWADLEGLMALMEQQLAEDEPHNHAEWLKVKEALGLGDLRQAVAAGGFEDRMWVVSGFVEAPAQGRGLLAALGGEPLTDEVFKLVPATASFLSAWRIDPYRLVTALRDAAAAMDPQVAEQYAQGRQQVREMLGFDLEEDLLKALGDQWAVYTDAAIGGQNAMGLVLVSPLRDEAKARRSLAAIEQMARMMIQQNMRDPEVHLELRTELVGDVELHYLAVPFVAPTWAVANGRLYVGLFPQVVLAAHHQAQAGEGSILDNEDFTSLRQSLGGGQSMSLQYLDLPQTAPAAYPTLLAFERLVLGFADLGGVAAPILVVPPLPQLREHLTPAGTATWRDEDGWHLRLRSPFPGSMALATQGVAGLQSAPVAVGVLLPALGAARRTARQMKATTQLRGIHQAMVIYSTGSKGGVYPPDMATLVREKFITLEYALSPMTGTVPPGDFDRWPQDQQDQWINENASFEMLVWGEKPTEEGGKLAGYLKPEHSEIQGTAMVWDDGHAEWLRMDEALHLIAEAQAPAPEPVEP